ncbi:MAG: NAD(P)/FAD-dependent oxidoreductase [Acidimicrobiales bacterium]
MSARAKGYADSLGLPEAGNGAPRPVVAIGAGPAGLTAAYKLLQGGANVLVLEADSVVGGISRTVQRDGWRFDIGGHRFFTKVPAVEAFWHEILSDEEFLMRPRMSRIFYDGKFFDYPIRAVNALKNLGLLEAALCMGSYAWVRIRPPSGQDTFEGWTASRFGWRLYRKFFKSYTEKVWGMPATDIKADWAAQRIKNLSLGKAVLRAMFKRSGGETVTSLIEEFQYPMYGPGMMWERCCELVKAGGGTVLLDSPVVAVRHVGGIAIGIAYRSGAGDNSPAGHGSAAPLREVETEAATGCQPYYNHLSPGAGGTVGDGDSLYEVDVLGVISSMPLKELVGILDPPPPQEVLDAAGCLSYRDFLTVALTVPESCGFPDNWIYIHDPGVYAGRIQNFGSWSPWMVKSGQTCLGMEYFVSEGDELWEMPDEELVELAKRELDKIGLAGKGAVENGYVVRMPKAYPVYDEGYQEAVETIRKWLDVNVANVYPVGRNGMHRYNNQDHSMYTAMLAVENLLQGAAYDVWSVNVEADYHEEHAT